MPKNFTDVLYVARIADSKTMESKGFMFSCVEDLFSIKKSLGNTWEMVGKIAIHFH